MFKNLLRKNSSKTDTMTTPDKMNEQPIWIAIIALLLSGIISHAILFIMAMKNAGTSFFEYIQLSDFGFAVILWDYNPVWTMISLALVLSGMVLLFLTTSKMRKMRKKSMKRKF